MKPFRRHIFVCTGPRCTPEGKAAEALFQRLGELLQAEGLLEGEERVKRTRAHCFAYCREGPLLVVYPDGIWYKEVSEERLQRIVRGHLKEGRPVEPWVFHRV
ncbi:(2Fe-2S) ferredoxin domain-containing protein [Thermus tengchongensis]|uniref:(2Fe-2S) ferredoxin domain-containing protein n=1 Tax=Thermus tengchongensis TaxID=1214928 RepID=A0ABY2K389_9DEIN|nr:hypothetical protein [Thermus tengchongensis]TFU14277.1 hypothetical protein E0489_12625 [Thermus tengchongensis]